MRINREASAIRI